MATIANSQSIAGRTETFWPISAGIMTAVLVCGFSFQLAMGRSTFASPLYVHVHAFLFFGWTMLYLLQNILAGSRGGRELHRRLGWVATVWAPAMVAMGLFITVEMVRQGRVPFFFTPLHFLAMNGIAVLTFAGLTAAALVMRRQTQWHRRLMFCGMAMLTSVGFGRLLPAPLLIPYVSWAIFGCLILFPIAGMIRDYRRGGWVHPAWWCGVAVMFGATVLMDVVTNLPPSRTLYALVTQGSPGAKVPPLAYPPMPPM